MQALTEQLEVFKARLKRLQDEDSNDFATMAKYQQRIREILNDIEKERNHIKESVDLGKEVYLETDSLGVLLDCMQNAKTIVTMRERFSWMTMGWVWKVTYIPKVNY